MKWCHLAATAANSRCPIDYSPSIFNDIYLNRILNELSLRCSSESPVSGITNLILNFFLKRNNGPRLSIVFIRIQKKKNKNLSLSFAYLGRMQQRDVIGSVGGFYAPSCHYVVAVAAARWRLRGGEIDTPTAVPVSPPSFLPSFLPSVSLWSFA